MLRVQMEPLTLGWVEIAVGAIILMVFLGLCIAVRIHLALLDIHEELHDIGTELKKARKRETS